MVVVDGMLPKLSKQSLVCFLLQGDIVWSPWQPEGGTDVLHHQHALLGVSSVLFQGTLTTFCIRLSDVV